ncbi:MAG: hypothetical protein H6667_00430 [Ardenticatenaceae bacterium]|nr:hypothetical protein [Ardenticatenaceae bacterium]
MKGKFKLCSIRIEGDGFALCCAAKVGWPGDVYVVGQARLGADGQFTEETAVSPRRPPYD